MSETCAACLNPRRPGTTYCEECRLERFRERRRRYNREIRSVHRRQYAESGETLSRIEDNLRELYQACPHLADVSMGGR